MATGEEVTAPPAVGVLDPSRALKGTLRGIAAVAAPTSIVTGLLYYFGWARTNAQARLLGLDSSLLDLSSQDYILRSIAAMFFPVLTALLVSIAALLLHVLLLVRVGDPVEASTSDEGRARLQRVRLIALGVAAVGAWALVLGVGGSLLEAPTRAQSMGYPLCITASVVLISYAVYLRLRFRTRRESDPGVPELGGLRLAITSLVILLLVVCLFWSVSNYAEIKGQDYALLVEQRLPRAPDVTIYSAKRLALGASVTETALAGDDAAYRFRYDNLKLLFRAGKKLFLRPSDPAAPPVNIVLAEAADLRFEFVESGRSQISPPKGDDEANPG